MAAPEALEGLGMSVRVTMQSRSPKPWKKEPPPQKENLKLNVMPKIGGSSAIGRALSLSQSPLVLPLRAETMTADELRAEIEATKTRMQAAVARSRELEAATHQATERQRLRRELEEQRWSLESQLQYNADDERYRSDIDEDSHGVHLVSTARSVPVPAQVPLHESNMCASSEEITSFGSKVAKGEYTWKLAEMSWLRSTVRYASGGFVMSELFQVGACKCHFFYDPDGGLIQYDGERVQNMRGSLAIIAPASAESFVLRYSIYAKSRGGDFVQSGRTWIANNGTFRPVT